MRKRPCWWLPVWRRSQRGTVRPADDRCMRPSTTKFVRPAWRKALDCAQRLGRRSYCVSHCHQAQLLDLLGSLGLSRLLGYFGLLGLLVLMFSETTMLKALQLLILSSVLEVIGDSAVTKAHRTEATRLLGRLERQAAQHSTAHSPHNPGPAPVIISAATRNNSDYRLSTTCTSEP
jgi:hypothetical protein